MNTTQTNQATNPTNIIKEDNTMDQKVICGWHHFNREKERIFFGIEDRESVPFIAIEAEYDNEGGEDRSDLANTRKRNKVLRQINKGWNNQFWCYEWNGGLSRAGFESVSQPASISWWEANRENFAEMLSILVKNGYESDAMPNCALHMHIDYKYFGEDWKVVATKMICLFNKFKDQMSKFSRRTSQQIDNWADFWDLWEKEYGEKWLEQLISESRWPNGGECYRRYRAVNLEHYDAIEIRLWKGTLNIDTFFATLKFTARLAEIVKNHSWEEIDKMSWEDVLDNDPDILTYWETIKDREM